MRCLRKSATRVALGRIVRVTKTLARSLTVSWTLVVMQLLLLNKARAVDVAPPPQVVFALRVLLPQRRLPPASAGGRPRGTTLAIPGTGLRTSPRLSLLLLKRRQLLLRLPRRGILLVRTLRPLVQLQRTLLRSCRRLLLLLRWPLPLRRAAILLLWVVGTRRPLTGSALSWSRATGPFQCALLSLLRSRPMRLAVS